MPKYYTKQGKQIYNPSAYAKTGAPMYSNEVKGNINAPTKIYKLNLEDGPLPIIKTLLKLELLISFIVSINLLLF